MKLTGGTMNGNSSPERDQCQAGRRRMPTLTKSFSRWFAKHKAKKSKTQHLADRIAFWLTIIAMVVGFRHPGSMADCRQKLLSSSLEKMASVMVITCPHALGLAVPLVVAISTSLSAKPEDYLIRNRTAFSKNAREISLLVFDKTGTLTRGKFGVTRYKSLKKGI